MDLTKLASEAVPREPQVAMIAMQSSGDHLDVQMGLSHGELDMDSPHGYMLNWLGQNWEMIHKMCQVSFTAYKDSKDPSKVSEAKIVEPTGLKLVSADGQSLIQPGA